MHASKSTLQNLDFMKFYLPRAKNVRYRKTKLPDFVQISIETALSTKHYGLTDKRLRKSDDIAQTVSAIISDPQDAICTYGGADIPISVELK